MQGRMALRLAAEHQVEVGGPSVRKWEAALPGRFPNTRGCLKPGTIQRLSLPCLGRRHNPWSTHWLMIYPRRGEEGPSFRPIWWTAVSKRWLTPANPHPKFTPCSRPFTFPRNGLQ